MDQPAALQPTDGLDGPDVGGWAAALTAASTDRLAGLLAADLVYIHSTGAVHDRASYLAFVAGGPSFLSVKIEDAGIRRRHDLAIVSGLLRMVLEGPAPAPRREVCSLITQVWQREDDRAWRLARAQATRPAP